MRLTKPAAPKPEKTLLACRLELELYDRFRTECERTGISVSEGTRQLIQAYLGKGPRTK